MKLNRSITDSEFAALGAAGCTGCTMTTISLPLDGPVVTQLDVDAEAANLAEAIQAGLDAVKTMPDLEVRTLDVPPQSSGLPDEDAGAAAGGNGHAPNGVALRARRA
jgi:hypothetical protein